MGRGSILIVEANPGVLIVARNVLAREGYVVYTAADPDDGLARMRDAEPDLLLLDAAFAWPDVITDFGRASPTRLPILVLVPNGMGEHILGDLHAEGAQEVVGGIEKPFVPDQLIAQVNDALLDHKETKELEIDSAEFAIDPVVIDLLARSEGLTYQETLDAEVACELLGVKQLGPIKELRSALVIEQTNPRASRLAERIRHQIPKKERTDWLDGPQFDRAVARALAEDEVYGAIAMPDPNAVLAGKIGDVSVAHLLQFADGIAGRIVCALEHEYERVEVTIEDHQIVGASHRNLPDRYRLGWFLTDAGLIDAQALDRHLGAARPSEKLGAMLCRLDLVAWEDVEQALTTQVEEIVYAALAWKDGRFTLVREQRSAGAKNQPLPDGQPISAMLLEGLRRQDEWAPQMSVRTRPDIDIH